MRTSLPLEILELLDLDLRNVLTFNRKATLKENVYSCGYGDYLTETGLDGLDPEKEGLKLVYPKGSVFYGNYYLEEWVPEKPDSGFEMDCGFFPDDRLFENIEPFNPIVKE